MKNLISRSILGCSLALMGATAQAQGLENIIVEEYYTITQADADYYNNEVGGTYPLVAGMKCYRIFVDMAPGYRFLTAFGDPAPQGGGASLNPLDFTTTTTFWNDDNYGDYIPTQTRRLDEGSAFDSYLTVGRTGTSGGAAGCGSNLEQLGVPRAADTNGNLTMCTTYSGFQSGDNDGNIPGTVPSLTLNLGGTMDFAAFTEDGSSFVIVDESWATLPANTGVDPQGANTVMIAQLTTNGDFSFHLNIDISDPQQNIETYVWNQAGPGRQRSDLLIFPQPAQPEDCLGVEGGTALPGTPCDDGLATTGNDTWTAECECEGQLIDCLEVPGGTALPGTACNDNNPATGNDQWSAGCVCVGQTLDCLNVPGGTALPGTACNDNDATTEDDTWTAECACEGTPIVVYDCPALQANIGDACNDNDATTENDTVNDQCVCAGTPIVIYDCPVLEANIGDDCNDNDATTENDTINDQCVCAGTPIVIYDC
ncbi:MAG TPA: hypothetical protein VGE21_07100, partial [Flavobacteriales bacterium]